MIVACVAANADPLGHSFCRVLSAARSQIGQAGLAQGAGVRVLRWVVECSDLRGQLTKVLNEASSAGGPIILIFLGHGCPEYLRELPSEIADGIVLGMHDLDPAIRTGIVAYACHTADRLGAELGKSGHSAGFVGFDRSIPFLIDFPEAEATTTRIVTAAVTGALTEANASAAAGRALRAGLRRELRAWAERPVTAAARVKMVMVLKRQRDSLVEIPE